MSTTYVLELETFCFTYQCDVYWDGSKAKTLSSVMDILERCEMDWIEFLIYTFKNEMVGLFEIIISTNYKWFIYIIIFVLLSIFISLNLSRNCCCVDYQFNFLKSFLFPSSDILFITFRFYSKCSIFIQFVTIKLYFYSVFESSFPDSIFYGVKWSMLTLYLNHNVLGLKIFYLLHWSWYKIKCHLCQKRLENNS